MKQKTKDERKNKKQKTKNKKEIKKFKILFAFIIILSVTCIYNLIKHFEGNIEEKASFPSNPDEDLKWRLLPCIENQFNSRRLFKIISDMFPSNFVFARISSCSFIHLEMLSGSLPTKLLFERFNKTKFSILENKSFGNSPVKLHFAARKV